MKEESEGRSWVWEGRWRWRSPKREEVAGESWRLNACSVVQSVFRCPRAALSLQRVSLDSRLEVEVKGTAATYTRWTDLLVWCPSLGPALLGGLCPDPGPVIDVKGVEAEELWANGLPWPRLLREHGTHLEVVLCLCLQSCPEDLMDEGILKVPALFPKLCVLCLAAQSCPTLCNPMDCSPPAQARVLEWLPCPPPGDLPNPGMEPALQVDSLPSEPPGKPVLKTAALKWAFISCYLSPMMTTVPSLGASPHPLSWHIGSMPSSLEEQT